MKPTKTNVGYSALIFAAIAGLTSCKKDSLPLKSNDKTFSATLFKQNLQQQLAGARGYQFVITQNGQVTDTAASGVGAFSRAGNMPADINAFINIASVTKTLTAVTALQYLDKPALTIDSAIGRWLPATWVRHADIQKITFRQLLTHTSGIRGDQTDWNTLWNIAGNPINAPKFPGQYSNINFALFRAILPKLHDSVKFRQMEFSLSPTEFSNWMSQEYIKLVQQHVFTKAGLPARNCVPVAGKTLQMMNEDPDPLDGATPSDWTDKCGGGGFFLTTMDMARVITYLANTDNVLSATQRTLMDKNKLGWSNVFEVTGGTAYGHNGALYVERNNTDGVNKGDLGLQTMMVKFPAKVELALGINSIDSTWRKLEDIIKTAYDAAWVNN